MKRIHASILLALGLATPLAYGQKATNNPPPKPLEATVCEILDNPSAYNNRRVKVRGYVSASSEYLATRGRTMRYKSYMACVR